MVAQFTKNGNDNRYAERQLPDVREQVAVLERWVAESAHNGTAAHEVERGLFVQLLALGHRLFQGFLNLVGPGDFGPSVTLDGGHEVQRSAQPHERRHKTVFGDFT